MLFGASNFDESYIVISKFLLLYIFTLRSIVSGNLTIESLADEFCSDSHSADVGTSLAAIGAMTQNVRPDTGFADPRLGAIPTMRFANEEDMSLRVRELAQLVGQEKFYLTVGGLLHKKAPPFF